ncbi:MAG: RecX family transcriptional regulator [Deltaproteobacteria bacterium]|nr:RecX family transcriptional regulator [Deltaproteobacteria bacterium]
MKKKITDLKIQKNNRQRVSVFLDDKYAFSLSLSAALDLKKGCLIESARIDQLLQQDEFPRSYNSAVRYLTRRPRSIHETRVFLTGKGYGPDAVQKTIDRLADQNYLDDSEYARLWIENRMHFRPRSAFALGFELRQKGVADAVIENMLHEFDDDKAAWKAIQGHLKRWQSLDGPQFKSKLFGFLKTRGFCYDTCRNALERAWLEKNGPKKSR